MKYVSSLFRWIFSGKQPLENAEYAPGAFVRLLMNAVQAKGQIRRRRFIIAIDETHEPFYGLIKNL